LSRMRVEHTSGIDGASRASGVVVIIDVLRAFTVSAYALAQGASECWLVGEVADALELQERTPASIISAEVDGLPVPGIAISNSPTQVLAAEVRGHSLIQRTSAGTQAVLAARAASQLYAASLVVAAATARAIAKENPPLVTLVASGRPGRDEEDFVCAEYLAALLLGTDFDLAGSLLRLRSSERCQELARGLTAGFPASDLDLSLTPDRFQFCMPVTDREGRLVLIAETRF